MKEVRRKLRKVAPSVFPERPHEKTVVRPDGLEETARRDYEAAVQLLGVRFLEGEELPEGGRMAQVVRDDSNRRVRLDRVKRAVVLHRRPFEPREMFNFTDEFTFYLPSIKKDFQPFLFMTEKAKRKSGNKNYGNFIDAAREWVMPTELPVFSRCGLVWTDWKVVGPRGSKRTARLDGAIVPYTRIGAVASSVLNRSAIDNQWYRLLPEVLSAPWNIMWYRKPLGFHSKGNVAVAYWFGVPNYNRLDELLDLDVDIYVHLRNRDRLIYAQFILRASTEYVEGKPVDFSEIEGDIMRISPTFHRVGKNGVREVASLFVPGAPPPREIEYLLKLWKRHSIPSLEHNIRAPNEVLPWLASRITADDTGGNVPVGKDSRGVPVFLDGNSRHSWYFTAQSDSGKTTWANWVALLQTPFVLSLQLTPTDKEAAHRWAEKFGGVVECWDDLPDAQDPKEQLKLFKSDEREVEEFFKEELERWIKNGRPSLPRLIYPGEETVRYIHKLRVYLNLFIITWKAWWDRTGDKCVIIIDDFVGIPSDDRDLYLVDIPKAIGDQMKDRVRWTINNCRKWGVEILCTGHTEQEVEEGFPYGTLSSFTTQVDLEVAGRKISIKDPKKRAVIARGLDTRLYSDQLKFIGR